MHSVLVSVVANALAVAQPASFLLLQRNDDASPFVACGCLGFFGLIMVGIIALNIALLIWVARDAKSRGMDNAVVWMIIVMLTGIIGLIIYLFTRPQGNLVPCPQCGNKRLQVSAKCPHCGNS
jgi:amino acid transporter